MFNSSLFKYISTIRGSVTITIFALIVTALVLIAREINLNVITVIHKILRKTVKGINRFIGNKELKYHRDLEIGKINEKMMKVKVYRFLNDLIIDLGLKRLGATPYEFLFIVEVVTLVVTIAICQMLFGNLWMAIPLYPIVFAGIMCGLYTKANIAHDTRIEDVIEAENIISNNIKDGVVVAIRNSLDMIPQSIRHEFIAFLDNVEHKNYHIKTALLDLNHRLGSIADDFIKKCIIFEMEEEHGLAGMFKDVVEINNMKMEMRNIMKRKFEEVVTDFIISATMIFVFLGGVIAIYPNVGNFYLHHPLGQIIIALDALIIIGEFVYITYLRAKEL